MQLYTPGLLIASRCEAAGHPLLGGTGIVYLCFDHQADRPGALKTFKAEYLPDRAVRDCFLHQGRHTYTAIDHRMRFLCAAIGCRATREGVSMSWHCTRPSWTLSRLSRKKRMG